MIANHFLATFSREDGKSFTGFSRSTEEILLAYPWPGNVRQLQNVVRSIVVLNDGLEVTADAAQVDRRCGRLIRAHDRAHNRLIRARIRRQSRACQTTTCLHAARFVLSRT